jgi:hypothetical protein
VKTLSRLIPLLVLLLFALALSACDPGVPCPPEYLVTKTTDTNDGICDAADSP